MKFHLSGLTLLVALASLFVLGAVACSSSDNNSSNTSGASPSSANLSMSDYLKQVNQIQDGVSKATDDIGDKAQFAFTDPAKARSTISAAISVGDSAVAALQRLNPPDTAKTEHENLISAGQNLVSVAKQVQADLQGVTAGPAFDTFKAKWQAPDSALSQALTQMKTACTAMQALATNNKVDVAISCPTTIT